MKKFSIRNNILTIKGNEYCETADFDIEHGYPLFYTKWNNTISFDRLSFAHYWAKKFNKKGYFENQNELITFLEIDCKLKRTYFEPFTGYTIPAAFQGSYIWEIRKNNEVWGHTFGWTIEQAKKYSKVLYPQYNLDDCLFFMTNKNVDLDCL